MSSLDILILAVIAVGAVIGFRRGIVVQVGQIAALTAGVILSRLFGPQMSALFAGGHGSESTLNYVCGHVVVFIAAYVVTLLVFRMIRGTVHCLSLGIIDRLAGAVFKAAQWLLLLSVALNIFFLVSGGDEPASQPGKPWRSAAFGFAPALLGYLTQPDNLNATDDVKS